MAVERGNLRVLSGDLAGAAADFDRARGLDPAHPGAWIGAAEVARLRGDEAAAEAALRAGIAAADPDPALPYALGLCLVRQGRRAEAIDALAAAVALAPDDPGYTAALTAARAPTPPVRDPDR